MSFKITIRGVSLEEVSNKYRSNYYNDLLYPGTELKKSNVEEPRPVISNDITTVIDNTLQMTEKVHPYTRSSITTISYMYSYKKVYVEHQPCPPFNCMNCLKVCDHEPVGIPIAMTYLPDGKPCYHVVGMFCGFPCAYAELYIRQNHPNYSNSTVLLYDMWEKGTGRSSKELQRAPDKYLLKIFNGPLTHEEYHNLAGHYSVKPTNYVLIPVQLFLEK